jgi:murein DD-endopeptidase MepM/ murein hydrolase activator NlpD
MPTSIRSIAYILLVGIAYLPLAAQNHIAIAVPYENTQPLRDTVAIDCRNGDIEDVSFEDLDKEVVTVDTDTTVSSQYTIPAHDVYAVWRTDLVNPYQVRLVGKPDTTVIPLTGYVHPKKNVVTSEFGLRRGYRQHNGIDVRLQRGDSVLCAFDGMVRIARRGKGFGYYVVVRHYNGLETVYGHFSKLAVTPNQEVKAGELLGFGGSTGRSSGPHLHYEIRYLGVPINPRDIIDFDHYAPKSDTLLLCASHFDYIKDMEKMRLWVVKKGETLGHIAMRTGIPISRLCTLNNINRNSVLRIGQKVRYT